MEHIMKKLCKLNNNAQMILLAGIMITILILSITAIFINLSNIGVNLSLEESSSELDEYTSVRSVFMKVFNQSCNRLNDYTMINQAFNYTKQTLFDIELRYGNYLNAELVQIKDYDDNQLNVTINLNFITSRTVIDEKISIPVYVNI
jgi:hypothetical protein